MRRPSRLAAAAVAAAILAPGTAEAHAAFAVLGSFWSGALHPLTAPDEFGVLLALALWARLQDGRREIALLAALFAGSLLGVTAIGRFGLPFATESATAVLMVGIGLAGALRLVVGTRWQCALFLLGGSIVGGASAAGTTGVSLALFAVGAAVASISLISYALIATARAEAEWARIALRAAASWIAAVGLMIAALAGTRLFGSA